MKTVFKSPLELLQSVGKNLGESTWLTIDQKRIDTFADATDDHQWIHSDPERAQSGPFGSTIAHGYLTLSLASRFLPEIIEVQGISMGINYGCHAVRFPAVVKVGSRLRGRGELVTAEEVKSSIQAVIRLTVELEKSERPACVVDTISRFYPS